MKNIVALALDVDSGGSYEGAVPPFVEAIWYLSIMSIYFHVVSPYTNEILFI